MTEGSEEKKQVRGKVVAVVSGKGGSGKTMVAVALAQGVAQEGREAVLVDADFATGGLTYYLTFREFSHTRAGFSDFLEEQSEKRPVSEWAVIGNPQGPEDDWLVRVRLVSIGDQRRIRDDSDMDFARAFREVLSETASLGNLVIVDCRGGIDRQSLAVCSMVDEILVVVETDTTSIRASQHLADALADQKLKIKVAGFVLNKVMDDPTSIAKTVSSLLGIAYLGSIPFDIEATRSYIQGKIPASNTLFCRHVFVALSRLIPNFYYYSTLRVLTPEEFSTVALKSPDARLGGIAIFVAALYLSAIYYWFQYADISFFHPKYLDIITIFFIVMLIVGALSDAIKQYIGQSFRNYLNLLNKILPPWQRRRRL